MGTPKISIVVPFHNVEQWLRGCLDTLARQTLTDFEVVMVDDGSTDLSAVVAKDVAALDSRFRLIQQENQGLGPARDAGARLARGEYLAFADGADLLPPQAYDLLVGSLESTGSDLVSGDVRTFGVEGLRRSWLPAGLFTSNRTRTHVGKDHRLLWDRSLWNKVFRRATWEVAPPGPGGEIPLTMRAHVRAQGVDVVREVVYYRRRRPDDLRARIDGLHHAACFFEAEAPELKNAFDKTVLLGEIRLILEELAAVPREDLLELAAGYLRRVDASVYAEVGAAHRLALTLAREGELAALLKAGAAEEPPGIVRRGLLRRRLYHDVPEVGVKLPDGLFRAERDLTLRAKVDSVAWRGESLIVTGHAYLDRLEMGRRDRLRAWLQDTRSGARIPLKLTRERRPDVTAASGQSRVCHDWAGFRAEVAAKELQSGGRWQTRVWELRVAVNAGGQHKQGPTGPPADLREHRPAARAVAERCWVRPLFTEAGRFQIRVRKPKAAVSACRTVDEGVRVEGWIKRFAAPEPPVLVAVRRRDGAEVRRALELVAEDERHQRFTVTIPVGELADPPRSPLGEPLLWEGEESRWGLQFEAGGERFPLAADDLSAVHVRAAGGEAVLTHGRYGAADILLRPCLPVIVDARWSAGGGLVLTGRHLGEPTGLSVRRRVEGDCRPFAVTWEDDRFRAELDPAGLPTGVWELLDGNGRPVVVDGPGCLPAAHVRDDLEFDLRPGETGALLLGVRQALADDERGRYARRVLERTVYPKLRREPLRPCVVFDSGAGTRCAGDPRALFEHLAGSRLDLVWVRSEGRFAVPEGARSVVRDSRAHVEALATARYIVADGLLPAWFRKRPGQTYLQTWHGAPPEDAAGSARLAADVRQWDYLLSPNAFSTPMLRRAFRYPGEVLECGSPRNDVLLAPGADERGRAARVKLGVPEGRRVVLYLADEFDPGLAEAVPDAVVLVRGHDEVGPAIDVTKFPDMAELFLAADVLVTGYSTAMFDFALTGRPMVFFGSDLECHSSFDLPGPLVRDSGELAAALAGLDGVAAAYAGPYRSFKERFCRLDDGGAAARVAGRVFVR
ncbi:bifunctional glycosyltransferase/CDP-glycerol:glycerophosphate glycerophosphotransferase [Nonomuraea typhae]|uniref:bifunctional glycosyltransferase/CDP-glycerol:glycerophosphate glycerophosphotransferase n=1 Tax=Nonomuraea typhae TaxID=2603600 RepID=UPI0015E217F5|nr:CDP-glycerol glycerophosphotransferase family protein [Nonomuraea typhae]